MSVSKKQENPNQAQTQQPPVEGGLPLAHVAMGKAGISDDLLQLKAFAEKVYDEAVRLRGGGGAEEGSYDFLLMTVKSDSARLKERFFAYQKALEEGLELRTKDFDDLQDIESLYEKVRAILADETNDIQELTASHLALIRERKAKEKEEKAKKAIESAKAANSEKPASLSETVAEGEETDEAMHDIRRAQFKDFLERSKELSEQQAWTTLREKSKYAIAGILILFIPIFYLAYGYLSTKDRVKVDHFVMRDVFQMESAYEKGNQFIAVVEPSWKSLYPDEKNMMLNNLSQRLGERINTISVYDPEGVILAEYKNGKASFF